VLTLRRDATPFSTWLPRFRAESPPSSPSAWND
jgi:hypothetical protein